MIGPGTKKKLQDKSHLREKNMPEFSFFTASLLAINKDLDLVKMVQGSLKKIGGGQKKQPRKAKQMKKGGKCRYVFIYKIKKKLM